ncbi:hypothetical protein SSU98_0108 [Streptococcus suis 98HAH33]|nr:hypothetical protein SSU98_0108 [Streptococcus suis 98HAH33]
MSMEKPQVFINNIPKNKSIPTLLKNNLLEVII